MDLPVNPNFTQFRSREPADSRVEKFVKAYTKANCEVRVNMVLEEAITWPKMLVKAFEKMHQMRKVGFKKAASLKRQSKPRIRLARAAAKAVVIAAADVAHEQNP